MSAQLSETATAPFDPISAAGYMGGYRLETGKLIFIGNAPTADQLAYYDFETGRIGALSPVAATTFSAGPALFIPEPIELQIAFVEDDRGNVSGLVWREGERPALTAARIPLAQEAVAFQNGDVSLAGTLILPATRGPHPAVVMIHGSGPQGRHNMRPVADFLAHHGIAALVYDKRGVGESSGDWTRSTFDDLVADALAGFRLLRGRADIHPGQVGLWGRSQGGWLGPLAASRCADVAFVVSVVGPAVGVVQQELDRIEYQLRADGFSEDDIAQALAYSRLAAQVMRTGEGWPQVEAATEQVRGQAWESYVGLVESKEHLDLWRQNDYDPVPVLQALTCPILALFGERDTLVPVATNKALMEQALRGNPDHTIAVLPRANHYSLVAETGGREEVPRLREFVREYFPIMADWILERQ